MKKIFGIVLLSVMSLSFLVAQEEDSSFGEPSFSLENELIIKVEKAGEDSTKGNYALIKEEAIENETTAKFAIGFNFGESFTLAPYIKDTVGLKFLDAPSPLAPVFNGNKFTLGIDATYEPMDMLSVMFGLGYDSQYKEFKIGSETNYNGNGINFNVGLGVSVESMFLEAGASYEFEGMFVNKRNGKEKKDYVTRSELANTITLKTTFDFFNFIKEGLNSGLVFENKTKFESNKDRNAKSEKKEDFAGEKITGNDFAIGLHFAPISYMDAKFLTTVAFEQTKEYDGQKYKLGEKSTAVGLSLGLEFVKDMFKIGIEYNPTLSKEKTEVTSGDKLETTKQKDLEHEFKIVVGIEL